MNGSGMPPADSWLPAGLRQLPRELLGAWPTPVSRLTTISRITGLEVWAKRDDLAGSLYGGNKVRKLELLLADARRRQARSVLTIGARGSHHVLATAIYAEELALDCHALIVPRAMTAEAWQQHRTASRHGAQLVECSSIAAAMMQLARMRARNAGTYIIPPGGSSPLGILGFVLAAFELRAQVEQALLPPPDVIFVPLGSGGTAAGLAAGCALAGLATRVAAVRIVNRFPLDDQLLRGMTSRALRYGQRAGLPRLASPQLEIINDYLGYGYGHPTPAAEHALRLAQETEGLVLETTYTAKTLAALLGSAHHLRGRPKVVLLWNTYNSRASDAVSNDGP